MSLARIRFSPGAVELEVDGLESPPAFDNGDPGIPAKSVEGQRSQSLIRLDVDDRVVGVEGLVFSGQGLELLHEPPNPHSLVKPLRPLDQPRKRSALLEPPVSDGLHRFVVGHDDPAFLGSVLEVDIVIGALGKNIQGTENIPASSPERFDERSLDVFVGV